MASFAIFDSLTTAQTLADGEFGVIGDTGSLRVAEVPAITATGTVAVSVSGVLVGGVSAIDFETGIFVLSVGASGRINAREEDTVAADDVDRAFVSNDGRILSDEDALDISGGGPITILNTGTLFGDSDGIVTDSVGSLTRIVNRGTIVGDQDGGIDHLAGDSFLLNRGTITGVDYGFDAAEGSGSAGRDEVRNFGSIEGGVFLNEQSDIVINGGEIDFVDLGDGSDFYVGRRQGSAQSVDGGDGGDILFSSRADDVLRWSGQRHLRVRPARRRRSRRGLRRPGRRQPQRLRLLRPVGRAPADRGPAGRRAHRPLRRRPDDPARRHRQGRPARQRLLLRGDVGSEAPRRPVDNSAVNTYFQ
jgi:hypothetical protein